MKKWLLFISGLSIYTLSIAQFDFPPESVGNNYEVKRMLSEAFCPSSVPKQKRLNGKILLTFIIRSDGSTDNLKFAKGINSEIDGEIQRIFPIIQWLPGIIDDEAVDAEHLLHIKVNQSFYRDSSLCIADTYESPLSFEQVEQKPVFLFGDLSKWIYNKLEYPSTAMSKGIQGTVKVRFVVEKNGKLSNIGIVQSVGGGCDEEAIRVIRITKWRPGKMDGKLVRTQINYPITFNLGSGDGFKEVQSGDMIRGQ